MKKIAVKCECGGETQERGAAEQQTSAVVAQRRLVWTRVPAGNTKIYTFQARIITEGTVSIEADSLETAERLRGLLVKHDCAQVNVEVGSGETKLSVVGIEDATPNDGHHFMQTPRANAVQNAEALADYCPE